ncbi:MAG TPA: [FeFe] hydrogenase H-cluster maturation GTPase HydF [Candidatus Merdivicinus excrementipullorum]|uniref:[FeFe] hydrogenase H-cluster maturation GTPase HydF n=1 Tax=Candidatus Merdivicinus excrementipullorum TaxID=2840867 RepID=A0A9D1FMA0_9FIRM|nr:[FeFe] hydrogenase H-cluster maturation GTPase HydF [Candidatus Merdivicinus excrementipullorum]
MLETPRANRLHIAFFGRTNSGKSTLLNRLAGQEISVVSEVSGTTTDPVYKSMELLPIGPVVLIDTAGLDDTTALGSLRTEKTREVMRKTDLAVLVVSSRAGDFSEEAEYLRLLEENKVKTVCVVNRIDGEDAPELPFSLPTLSLDARDAGQMGAFKKFLIQNAGTDFEIPFMTAHLVKEGGLVMLVMPQDIQAPKGRLILPQVQMTRELLDRRCRVISVVPDGIAPMLAALKDAPDLVITDSQVFKQVNELIPKEIPLTSFSVLLSENKGDIETFLEGAKAIRSLNPGDKVLIMEACTHHALEGDIARQKLPKLLEKFVGGPVDFQVFSGPGFPENIRDYKLILHCGGCMINRKNMLSKLSEAQQYGVPVTNFGIAIAYMNGMMDRICW